MKKVTKCVIIVILSIVLLLCALSGIAIWILCSGSGIDKTVRYVIENYSPYKTDVGHISLSIIGTFPDVGINIDDITVYNAPGHICESDTMLHIDKLRLAADAGVFREENIIKVQELLVDGLSAWGCIDDIGESNFAAFLKNTEKSDKDSLKTFTFPDSLNTKLIFDLQKLSLKGTELHYSDLSTLNSIDAGGIDVTVNGKLNPSLDGNAYIKMIIKDLSYISGTDSAMIQAVVKNMNLTSDLVLDNPSLTGNICISASSADASAQGVNAVLDNFSVKFDGNGNLSDTSIDGKLAVSSDNISVLSNTSVIAAKSLELDARTDGMCHINEMVNAVVTSSAKSVSLTSSLSSPIDINIGNIAISISSALNYAMKNGDADVLISTDNLAVAMNGNTHIKAYSNSMEFGVKGSVCDSTINCIPTIYSNSLRAVVNNEEYIRNWPVKICMPVCSDTAFHHIAVDKGLLSINNQDISVNSDCYIQKGAFKSKSKVGIEEFDIVQILDMLPSDVQKALEGISANGFMSINADGDFSVVNGGLKINNASATLSGRNLSGVVHDSISFNAENTDIAISVPYAAKKKSPWQNIFAEIEAQNADADIISASHIVSTFDNMHISAELNNILDRSADTRRNINADISVGGLNAQIDTIAAEIEDLAINGKYVLSAAGNEREGLDANITMESLSSTIGDRLGIQTGYADIAAQAALDTTKNEFLLRWTPKLKVSIENTSIEQLPVPLFIPGINFDFSLGSFQIAESSISLGHSDFSIAGNIDNIGDFIDKSGDMQGTLDFISDYADMTQLMSLLSGIGSEDRKTKNRDTQFADNDTSIASDPFIVPEHIDVVLNTRIKEMDFNNHHFHNVGGDVTLKDGSLILQELGFSSDAAEMQLTAIYKTPEPDNLYAGLDFHLLDIQIDELIDLIPSVDSIVPMLKAFDGKAQFHLAAETNLDRYYMPKMPTLIGAAAIEGKDLKIMDNEVFNSIKKKLLMSEKAENVIDSLSVEMQVLRNKVDLYPFLVHMDRYSAVIGGRHNINKSLDCNYHISIIQTPLPIRLGVNISGALSDIASKPIRHIKLTKCLYDNTFNPQRMNATDQRIVEMKKVISDTLKENVKN